MEKELWFSRRDFVGYRRVEHSDVLYYSAGVLFGSRIIRDYSMSGFVQIVEYRN